MEKTALVKDPFGKYLLEGNMPNRAEDCVPFRTRMTSGFLTRVPEGALRMDLLAPSTCRDAGAYIMVLWRNLICLESVKADFLSAHAQRVEMPISLVKTHKGGEVG